MGHMFHAAPQDLPALVAAYADAGPDPVRDHARRGQLFFCDHLEDLACLVADGSGGLAADFRPAVLADLCLLAGWAKADTASADPLWTPAAADAVLEAVEAAARRNGLPMPARETTWVSHPTLSWSGSRDEPCDALLAFGLYAARSHVLDCITLGADGACQVNVESAATMNGVPVRLVSSERPDMGAATVREGWARDGIPAVRFVSDEAGARFELNVATLDGFVLLDAVAGEVFPFPEELQSVRASIEEAWFDGSALPTLRDFLEEAAQAGDADAGRASALLDGDANGRWNATRRAWALAVRLAGLRPDPRTGAVPGWAAKGPEVARHFTDELVMATALEPRRAA